MTDKQVFGRLLGHLHCGGKYAYFWTSAGKRSTWFEVGQHAPIPTGEKNYYFGIHPSTTLPDNQHYSRSRIDTIAAINCLFAEFDAKDFDEDKQAAYCHMEGLSPSPSIVIDSGGGYHAYWLLDKPFIITDEACRKRAQATQGRWVEFVQGDTGAKDLARVLRIPGTYNGKYNPSRFVDFVIADFEKTYTLADLESRIISLHDDEANYDREAIPSETNSPLNNGAEPERLLQMAAERVTQGTRNDTGLWLANQLRDNGYGVVEATNTMLAYQQQIAHMGNHRYDEREALRTLESAYEKQPREPWQNSVSTALVHSAVSTQQQAIATNFQTPLTELGNAERLVNLFGDDLMYVSTWNKWYVWNGKYWREDTTGEVQRRARKTVRLIYGEATLAADKGVRNDIVKWARQSESYQRLKAAVAIAQAEPGIALEHEELDSDPWLITVANGTLDLHTGSLRSHRREDLITKYIPVEYHANAQAPLWQQFLKQIMNNNTELIRYLQKSVGYSLTGVTNEQCLFFMYGVGSNGKTTFIETLRSMFGDYVMKAPTDMLLNKWGGGGIPNDIARLPGMRFVVTAEVEEGRSMAESKVKDLTGGDTITARFMRGEWFSFEPTHKLWVYGNHKPTIRGTDDGIWRRMHLIPFSVTISDEDKDANLLTKLRDELPGILLWAAEGCLAWQQDGLGMPTAVRQATADYRADMDILKSFIDEQCIIGDGYEVKYSMLYSAYKDWCEQNGEKALSSRRFNGRMKERGIQDYKGAGNVAMRSGIGLLSSDESHEDRPPFTSRVIEVTEVIPNSSLPLREENTIRLYTKTDNLDNLDNSAVEKTGEREVIEL